MAVISTAVTVGTSAVALPGTTVDIEGPTDIETLVYNNGSVTIYVGGSDVTTSNGVPIEPGASLGITVKGVDTLYGISGSASQNVRVLEVG